MGTRTRDLVPGEHLKFVGNYLEASEEALRVIDRKQLSASTAKSMHGCHARYAAEKVLPREDDPFGVAQIGTAAHAVLENLMKLPGEERTTEAALDLLLADARREWPALPDGAPHPDRARWQKSVWDKVTGLWRIEDPADVDVVATEWRLSGVKVAGVPFVGFVDRTDRDENGLLRVVDYKSGAGKGLDQDGLRKLQRYGDDHGDQIRLYKLAMESMTGEEVGSGSLYYIGEGQAREVSFAQPHMTKVVDDFASAWDELKADVAAGAFETKAGPLCGWCPLVAICPAAALDGRTPRVDVPTPDELGIEVVSPTGAPTHAVGDPSLAETLEEAMADYTDYDPFEDFAEPAGATLDADDLDTDEDTAPEPVPLRAADRRRAARRAVADLPEADESDEEVEEPRARRGRAARAPEPTHLFGEGKSWEPKAGGLPNGNGYAAIGAFGFAELAIEQLTDAGAKLRIADITALGKTFALVVANAQEALTGSRNPADGTGTRMRGALRSTLKDMPAPIGKSADEWQTWMDRTTRRCITLGQVAHAILTDTSDSEPYLPLTSDELAA